MPRPPGSKNKKTLVREAAERERQSSLLPAVPFTEAAVAAVAAPEPLPFAQPATGHRHIEYLAPNEIRWRIENGKGLLSDFSLDSGDLPRWHGALAAEPNVWHLLRLHYGIAPLVGESNPEYLQPRPLAEIAGPLGLDEATLKSQVDGAVAFWVRWRVSQKSRIEESPAPPMPALADDEIEKSLKRYGLNDIKDADQRAYAAQRLKDFANKLDDEEGGSLPPQAVRLEVQLIQIDAIITDLSSSALTDDKKRGDMRDWITSRDKVAQQHLRLMEALNATQQQNPTTKRKVDFLDCLGSIVKAKQEYEARGDTELIDGFFSAAELKFLVQPTSLRPAQYRPDLLAILSHAMKPENFWDPEYVPPCFDRGTHRRLLRGFQEGTRAASMEDGGIPDLEDEETATPVQDFERPGENSGLAAPISMPALGAAISGVLRALPRGAAARPGEDIISS